MFFVSFVSKKLKALTLSTLMLGGLFLSPSLNADAASNDVENTYATSNDVGLFAWSSWTSVPAFGSSCKVRVYTDLLNYYASSDTVDIMAEATGCTRMEYTMSIADPYIAFGGIGNVHSGSFTTGTPLKSININSVKQKTTTYVELGLYNDLSNDNYPVATVYSSPITIYPQ